MRKAKAVYHGGHGGARRGTEGGGEWEGLGIGDWGLGEKAKSGRLEVGAWLGWLDDQSWLFGLDWWHLSLGIG
jgi:hypothetical protein